VRAAERHGEREREREGGRGACYGTLEGRMAPNFKRLMERHTSGSNDFGPHIQDRTPLPRYFAFVNALMVRASKLVSKAPSRSMA
jgi:hypothetical protein